MRAIQAGEPSAVRVGSKKFTESVILGEMATQLAVNAGAQTVHRRELGGTQFLWKALLAGEIDVYPEYTGTIREEILAGRAAETDEELRAALAAHGVRMSRPLGFNDTYALGMPEELAQRLGIRTISELRAHPDLRFAFSDEFMNRAEGWPSLRQRYGLPQADVRGMDHDLAYRGLQSGHIDVTDLYSTDAEIRYYKLRVLQDDLHHFPAYQAVLLFRADFAERAPAAIAGLLRLEGRISETEMIELNARAKLDKVPETRVAADFLKRKLALDVQVGTETDFAKFVKHTRDHLNLVLKSLACAILLAIPLGILAAKRPHFGQMILAAAGIVQTLPSLALLVFMIPLLGIGPRPAIVALFLYSLLPIIRNTYTGLTDITVSIRESAEALGLPPAARLRLIELPLAARAILAGIKTSAVINVGTATLGALIGAGGYGEPIFTGIRLDDMRLVLQGAFPAAALALVVQALFDLAERGVVPKGLRLRAQP
ncbi:MAG TPA: glycine betaine ABC transporter substrate-binding protein [Phycisphaerae bacterium]